MSDADPSDLEQRAANGDEAALAELFDQHRSRLKRIVDTRMDARVAGRVDASDILQDTFLELSRKLPNFDRANGMSMFVWMRLVATERVIVAHRRHLQAEARDARKETPRQSTEASSIFLAQHLIAVFGSAEHRVLRDEMFDVLKQTLAGMDPIDHEIITMRCFEELTNAEAAEALGISQNGASSRFVRAMTRLKKQLEAIPGFGA